MPSPPERCQDGPEAPQSAASADSNDAAARASRRHTDHVIVALVGDVAVLKDQMVENTRVTKEVRDILSTFRVLGTFATWIGSILAALVAAYTAVKGLRT